MLTASADVGLSLDKAGHGNYEMSLPNKLFDFMHAGLPMVVTARKEVAAIVRAHGLGEVVEEATPAALREAVKTVLATNKASWSKALQSASDQFHWGVDEPQISGDRGHLLEGPFGHQPQGLSPKSRTPKTCPFHAPFFLVQGGVELPGQSSWRHVTQGAL